MIEGIYDGGPAFPFGQVSEVTGAPINGYHNDGMSLRDWFAGMALQGYASHPLADSRNGEADRIAVATYRFADAMLKARRGVQP
jgi:hypothetical protein